MDASLIAEVKSGVELSLKGDPQSVEAADTLLGTTLPSRPGYLPTLFTIAVDTQEAKFNWKKVTDNTRIYSETDKELIRTSYFEGLIRCNDQNIVRLLGHALFSILVKDIDTWTTFEDLVQATMTQNPTHERIYCALVGLHTLTKVRQYYVNEDREPIEKTALRFFPTLLELATTLAKDFNPVNAMLVKEVLKIFYRTTRIDLSDYLRVIEVNDHWMVLMNDLFAKSIAALRQMQEAKISEHDYFMSSYWNNLKWILRIIKRYTFRYGDPDKEEKKYEHFATHWMTINAVTYWERLVEVITNRKVIHVPEKIIVVVLSILFNLFDSDAVIHKHEANFEGFLLDSMFDLVRFSKEDEELFQDNPVEYFRKNDEGSPNFGPTGQALNIFGKSFKRPKYLKKFMKFVNDCLSTGVNPRTKKPITVIDREAFFHIIEKNSIHVIKIKNCAALLQGLLTNFVEPELRSEHGFMRMRACKMVVNYGSNVLEGDILKKLSVGVVACIKDKELPVRSAGAQALEMLLKKEDLREYFLPELKEILKTYISLINEFENDSLIASLKGIFELYGEVIGPYALDLAQNLAELFFKCIEKEKKAQEGDDENSENEKEVMESGFAGQGCLVAIEEILHSTLDQSIIQKFYEVVEPIFAYVFGPDGLDFLGEGAAILNMIIHAWTDIPLSLWSYFVMICYALKGKPAGKFPDFPSYVTPKMIEMFNSMPPDDYASEFLNDLSPTLRNFVNKGNPTLLNQTDFYGVKFIDLLMQTVTDSLTKNLPHPYSGNEICDALAMCGFVFAQLPGALGPYLDQLLNISLEAVNTRMDQMVKDGFIHNIGWAVWNNTTATLEYLNSKGLLDKVLTSWPEQHKRVCCYRVRKASFVGLLSLFSLSTDQLQAAKIPILQIYKVMVDDLPKLAEDQEKVINNEYEDNSDFDDFGFSDEDEDDMVDIDLNEDDENDTHKPKKKNQKVDAAISKTQAQIDKLSADDKAEKHEAMEGWSEIENHYFNDAADKINEVLLFESTLTNLQTANPALFAKLQEVTTPEMKQSVIEATGKVKTLIDSR